MGHLHYMAPEMFDDSHTVTGAADVYSLDRILIYVLSGRHPKIMFPELPDGACHRVVSQLTHVEPKRRPAVDDISELITSSLRPVKTSVSRIRALLKSAPTDEAELRVLVEALNNLPPEREDEVFVDLLPTAPQELFEPLLAAHPEDAVGLAERIRKHVETTSWRGRNFDTLNEPLAVLLQLAAEANQSRAYDVLGRLVEQLFELDVHCDRYRSKGNVRNWLVRLRGRGARIVADALVKVLARSSSMAEARGRRRVPILRSRMRLPADRMARAAATCSNN